MKKPLSEYQLVDELFLIIDDPAYENDPAECIQKIAEFFRPIQNRYEEEFEKVREIDFSKIEVTPCTCSYDITGRLAHRGFMCPRHTDEYGREKY